LTAGDSFLVTCKEKNGNSKAGGISWYFNEELVGPSSHPNLRVSGNSLSIYNASFDSRGEVACKSDLVQNDVTFLLEDRATVTVNRKIIADINPPKFRADEGDLVTLTCTYTDFDPKFLNPGLNDKFVWKKDGQILSQVESSSYSFKAESRNDAGEYSCQIDDSVVKSNLAVSSVRIGREEPPELEFESSLINDDYILRCKANSYANLSQLEIVRVGGELTSHLLFGNASSQIIELSFLDDPKNHGFYKCQAENQYGSAYSVIEVPRCIIFIYEFFYFLFL
jgi:hypothetical protein